MTFDVKDMRSEKSIFICFLTLNAKSSLQSEVSFSDGGNVAAVFFVA